MLRLNRHFALKIFFLLLVSGIELLYSANISSRYLNNSNQKFSEQEILLIDSALQKIPSNKNLNILFRKVQTTVQNNEEFYFQKTASSTITLFYNPLLFNKTSLKSSNKLQKRFMREVIQSTFLLLDDKYKWSEKDEWLSINRWKKKFSKWYFIASTAHNRAPSGYIEKKGMKSPGNNLAVFASYYLLPDFTESDQPDRSLKCIYLPQSRFIEKIIFELDPDFVSFYKEKVPDCPSFLKWADFESIDHFEVILAAPSSVFIGSLFGHVFLRISQKNKNGLSPTLNERTFGFVAETYGLVENDPFYNFKGIFGLYTTIVLEKDFSEFYRQYVVNEDRDMKRWRINLTREQMVMLMERLWTMQQTANYRYYFFTDNCGTLLYDLLNGILAAENIQVNYPDSQASLPTATIDGYLQTYMEDNEMFFTQLDDIKSFKNEMVSAKKNRQKIWFSLTSLIINYPLSFNDKIEISKVKSYFDSEDKKYRDIAYNFIGNSMERYPSTLNAGRFFLNQSIPLESYYAIQKNVKKEKKINLKRVRALSKKLSGYLSQKCGSGKNFLLKIKKERYTTNADTSIYRYYISRCAGLEKNLQNEDPQVRIENYKNIKKFSDDIILMKEKEINPEIKEFLEKWRQELIHLTILQAYLKYDTIKLKATTDGSLMHDEYLEKISSLPDFKTEFDNAQYIYVSEVPETLERLIPYSGYTPASFEIDTADNQTAKSFRSGVDSQGFAPFYAHAGNLDLIGIMLCSSLLDEKNGEQRIAGFPSYASMKIFKNILFLGTGNGYLYYKDIFTLLNLRLLNPDTRSIKPGFEFSFDVDYENQDIINNFSNSAIGAEIQGGILFPVFKSEGYKNYFLIAPELMLRGFSVQDNNSLFAGIPLLLESRFAILPLSSGISYLSSGFEYMPVYNLSSDFLYHSFDVKISLYIQLSDQFYFLNSKPAKSLRFFIETEYQYILGNSRIHQLFSENFSFYAGFRLN